MNIKRPLVLAAFVALIISACSQPRDLTDPILEPQFGTAADSANAVAKHGSAIYVVGNTSGNLHAAQKGGGDAFIRKLDTSGKLLWGRQFGTNKADNPHDVATDAGGNAYIFGSTGGSLARTLRGPSDFFVRKYSPSGTHLWTKQMGLDTADSPGGVAVSGGFVYAVGVSQDLGTFAYRLHPDGRTYWKKQVAPALQYNLTSDLAADGAGNVYVASTVADDCDYWDGCTSVRLNKYNSAGTLVWSKVVDYGDESNLIAITAYGSSIYLAIKTWEVSDDDSYTHLVKLNSSGVAQWDKYISAYSTYSPPSYISTNLSADANGVYTASTEAIDFSNPDDYETPLEIHYSVAKFDTNGSLAWRVGPFYDHDGTVGEYLEGSLWGIVARGSSGVYVAGSVDGGPIKGGEALLKRLNAATGTTVWTR